MSLDKKTMDSVRQKLKDGKAEPTDFPELKGVIWNDCGHCGKVAGDACSICEMWVCHDCMATHDKLHD
jgi:hypothetical protein